MSTFGRGNFRMAEKCGRNISFPRDFIQKCIVKMTGSIHKLPSSCRLLVIALLALSCFPGTSQAASIICFGDSITFGYGSTTGGYPPKLGQLLQEHGKPAQLINLGIPGERSPEGATRLAEILKASHADIMLIMEGTNDVRKGLSVSTTQRSLDDIIKQAKEAGIVPIVATLTPSNQGRSPTLIPDRWNPMIKSLAAENKVLLSDHYEKIQKDWTNSTADGIHPNDNGYTRIAQIWYDTIADLIVSDGSVIHPDDDPRSFASVVFTGVAEKEKYLYLLRELRIRYIQPTAIGHKAVAIYTRHSQSWAAFIQQHEIQRVLTRICLYPLIGLSYVLIKASQPIQIAIAFTVIGLALTGITIPLRKKGKKAASQLMSEL